MTDYSQFAQPAQNNQQTQVDYSQFAQPAQNNQQPLQGGVSVWQQPVNLGAALTDTTPLASRPQANNIFNPSDVVQSALSGAAENIPYLGKAMEYSPQTIPGQVGKVVGNAAPWLYGAKEFGIAGNAIAGGYQGITGAINKGENLSDIAKAGLVGAGTGAALSAGLPLVGKAFEAIQPKIANILAGIPEESYQNALQSIKNGQSVFQNMPPNINEAYRGLAENISNTVQKAKNVYGQAVGTGTQALTNDAPIPVNQLTDIIDNSISAAGKGSKLNPTAMRTNTIANDLKDMLYKGSNLDDIAQSKLGISGDDLLNDMKQTGLSLNDYGIDPKDLTVDRVGLHNVKEDLQHQVNYNADYTPVKGVVKNWANNFNDILRENPDYAKANDQFSQLGQFLDNSENSWLNNTNSIASKLSNAGNKSGELADTADKITQLQNLLPKGNQFNTQLQNLNTQQDFTGGLSKWMAQKGANEALKGGLGGAGIVGGAAFHPLIPVELGILAQQSPSVQRLILQSYGAGRQLAPYLPAQASNLYNQMNQGGQ